MSNVSPLQLSLFPAPEPRPKRVSSLAATAEVSPSVEELRDRLNRHLSGRVASLVVTRNRDRILSVRADDVEPARLAARVDVCFLLAPEDIVRAMAVWIDGRRGHRQALASLRIYFEQNREAEGRPEPAPRATGSVKARGEMFDLQEIYDEVNRRYFGDCLKAQVTWSASPAGSNRRRRPQSLKLGSYSFRTGLIRIHTALDDASVPRFVVESVVFHEMLHAALGEPRVVGGRRQLHPPEFVAAERRFPHYEATERWVRTHLESLLRRARRKVTRRRLS